MELGVGGPGKGAQATKRSPCPLPIQEDSMLIGMSKVMLQCFPFRAIDIDHVDSHGVQKTCSPCPYLIAKTWSISSSDPRAGAINLVPM